MLCSRVCMLCALCLVLFNDHFACLLKENALFLIIFELFENLLRCVSVYTCVDMFIYVSPMVQDMLLMHPYNFRCFPVQNNQLTSILQSFYSHFRISAFLPVIPHLIPHFIPQVVRTSLTVSGPRYLRLM
jgi:hypothetical protein